MLRGCVNKKGMAGMKKEFLRVFEELQKEAVKWEEYLPDHDRNHVAEIFSYMEQYMSGGKFKVDTLLTRTWEKALTHEELYDLCENILNLLEYGPWDDLGDYPDYDIVLLIIAEQAAALMPLDIYGYESMYKLDNWQEINSYDDVPLFDSYMTVIFSNPECRQLIEKYAQDGQYLEMAEHIGIEGIQYDEDGNLFYKK